MDGLSHTFNTFLHKNDRGLFFLSLLDFHDSSEFNPLDFRVSLSFFLLNLLRYKCELGCLASQPQYKRLILLCQILSLSLSCYLLLSFSLRSSSSFLRSCFSSLSLTSFHPRNRWANTHRKRKDSSLKIGLGVTANIWAEERKRGKICTLYPTFKAEKCSRFFPKTIFTRNVSKSCNKDQSEKKYWEELFSLRRKKIIFQRSQSDNFFIRRFPDFLFLLLSLFLSVSVDNFEKLILFHLLSS